MGGAIALDSMRTLCALRSPSLAIEDQQDWEDRIAATAGSSVDRAWHFPLVLLTDRSASHRGAVCGSQTQRIASEAWEYMRRSVPAHGDESRRVVGANSCVCVGILWSGRRQA